MSSSLIKLKRTAKEFDTLNSEHLKYGEPLFVVNSSGSFLVLGTTDNNSVSIPNEKRVILADKDIAANVVYYKLVGNVPSLVDADGNVIPTTTQQPLNFSVDGSSTSVSYDGTSSVIVTASDLGAVSSEDMTVDSPAVTETEADRIATVGYVVGMLGLPSSKGYPVKTTITTPLEWNTEYRLGTLSSNTTITLPAVTNLYATEIRLCFVASNNISFNVTLPAQSGYAILGLEDFSSLSANTYYEISIANIGSDGKSTPTTYFSLIADSIALS